MSKFQPTQITFAEGKERIQQALGRIGHKMEGSILTSRDKDAVALCNLLAVSSKQIPNGFTKWQLPFYLDGGQFFISTAEPGAIVGEHAHDNDAVRFITSGSVFYDGIELNAGDWMFIPKNKDYSLKAGPLGAMMYYCYSCCCAGRDLTPQDLIDPAYIRNRDSLHS